MIIENDETDIPDFLNMSTKISVCKECLEAMVHLLLTPQFYQIKNINIDFT